MTCSHTITSAVAILRRQSITFCWQVRNQISEAPSCPLVNYLRKHLRLQNSSGIELDITSKVRLQRGRARRGPDAWEI